MPSLVTISKPRPDSAGGGRGPTDWRNDNGGGGGQEGGAPNYDEKLRRYRLGMAIFLVAVVALFVTFTMAFLVLEGPIHRWNANVRTAGPRLLEAGAYGQQGAPVRLPYGMLVVNTCVLLLSTLTLEIARRRAAERVLLAPLRSIPGIAIDSNVQAPWLGISIGLGLLFLGGQALAWRSMIMRGLDVYAGAAPSFFYVLTGAHAVHLGGGLLALFYAAATTLLCKPLEVRRIVIDVTSWYWHAMAFLWIYIFAVLSLA